MLDINIIINDPKGIESKLMKRGYSLNSTAIIDIYNQRKDLIKIKENIAADKNKLNDKFRDASTEDEKNEIKKQSQEFEKKISHNKSLLVEKESELTKHLLDIPNIPLDDVPFGEDDKDNKIIKTWGSPKKHNFEH